MRSRVVLISVLSVVVLLGCSKKVAVNNPALETTAVLYPFEPIPVAAYEGMGLAKHDFAVIFKVLAQMAGLKNP